MELKVGDLVQLKSGGPRMTVDYLRDDGEWWCVWFNGTAGQHEKKGSSFKAETLSKQG